MKFAPFCSAFLVVTILGFGCSDDDNSNPTGVGGAIGDFPMTATPLKWFDGKAAALTITYDAPWGTHQTITAASNEIIARELTMDHEMVTATYLKHPDIVALIRDIAIPNGIHFFGHGHEHVLHDKLSYEECYTSFKTCFDYMEEWEFEPRSYGYPGSSGYEYTTQLANNQAGFICARGVELDTSKLFICPDTTREPENWYYLPSLEMGETAKKHTELVPFVQKNISKKAWLILMYHSIGFEDSYLYYPWDEFINDIDYFAESDLWVGNMDMVASYIQERNKFYIDTVSMNDDNATVRVKFCDDLDNDIYIQPLTVDITVKNGNTYSKLVVTPAINGETEYALTNNTARVNVVPDEQAYYITFLK